MKKMKAAGSHLGVNFNHLSAACLNIVTAWSQQKAEAVSRG
jgi:hypothetical protein